MDKVRYGSPPVLEHSDDIHSLVEQSATRLHTHHAQELQHGHVGLGGLSNMHGHKTEDQMDMSE